MPDQIDMPCAQWNEIACVLWAIGEHESYWKVYRFHLHGNIWSAQYHNLYVEIIQQSRYEENLIVIFAIKPDKNSKNI